MSYIRSSSNPEALYIVATGNDILAVMWNDGSPKSVIISQKDFDHILKIYSKWNYDNEKIDTPSVCLYFNDNFKIVLKFINFSYDLDLELWRSTFEEIVSNYRWRKFCSFKNRLKFLFNKLNW